jgi:hypothetical protein
VVVIWSFISFIEIGIAPSVFLHPVGCLSGSKSILENFGEGRYFGVPIIEWFGMLKRTNNTLINTTISYPKRLSWLMLLFRL